MTTAEARERLYAAEDLFAKLTEGRELLTQDRDAARFHFCDGEYVTGWDRAAETAERHVRSVQRQMATA